MYKRLAVLFVGVLSTFIVQVNLYISFFFIKTQFNFCKLLFFKFQSWSMILVHHYQFGFITQLQSTVEKLCLLVNINVFTTLRPKIVSVSVC